VIMALSFKRPVGAAVDVKELEYISALHQTGMPSIRQDASIRDVDIVLFLKSRYGIVVTTDYVRKTVMKGLGGGDDEEEAIDLVELVSIILIPLLIKASRSSIAKLVGEERARTKEDFEYANDYWRYCEEKKIANKLAPPENIIEDVFSLLMGGATGDPSPKKLDENLVRSILSAHGENDLANDDLLVKEMVSAATTADTDNGSEPMFDSNAFAHALAGDIQDYKVENETKKTTAYFDVFGSHTYNEEEKVDTGIDLDQEARSSRPDKIKTEFTFASIDFVSGNYQSKTLAAALWTLFLIIFISYKEKVPQVTNALVCTKAQNLSFGCKVARHSLIWLEIFLEIFIFGLMFIGLGSIGNDIQSKRKYLIILGILVVGSVTFREYLNTPIPPDALFIDHFHRALPFALTFIVFFLQFNLLLGQYIPRKLLRSSRMLDSWFTPGNVVAESQTKQSAAYKINHLVKNARNLFGPSEELNSCQFSQGAATKALLNYGKKGKIFMTQGGFIWTWKRIFSLELFNENGIWISGRIIAGNFSQLLISVVIIVFGLSLTYYVDENLTTTFNELTSFMNLQQNEIEGIAKELVEHMNDRIGTTMRDSISENLDKYVLSGNLSLARNLTETWFNDTMETVLQYAYGSFRNETGSFNCFVEENLTNECKKTKRRHLKLQQNLAYMMTGPVSQNTKDSIEHGIRQIHESMAETQTIVTPERRRSRPHEDTEKWSVSKISQNAQGLEFCEDFSISEFCDSIEHFKNQVYDDFNSDEVFIEVTDQAIIFLNRTVEESTVSREEMLLTEVIQFSQKVSANTIEKLRPTHVYMITAPMYVGTFAAFLAILYIAVSLIPSAVTTTLRFRSGMIPTFRDPKFSKLRTGQEAVTKILGFILWGGFVSSAIFGALVAFIVFLFLYQVTRDVIFSFSAMAIGM